MFCLGVCFDSVLLARLYGNRWDLLHRNPTSIALRGNPLFWPDVNRHVMTDGLASDLPTAPVFCGSTSKGFVVTRAILDVILDRLSNRGHAQNPDVRGSPPTISSGRAALAGSRRRLCLRWTRSAAFYPWVPAIGCRPWHSFRIGFLPASPRCGPLVGLPSGPEWQSWDSRRSGNCWQTSPAAPVRGSY